MITQSTKKSTILPNTLNSRFWKITFLIAGIYTSCVVIPGIVNPEHGLLEFINQTTKDWNTIYFFRSLWITVFVFGIGFFIVATNPAKHIGIVIMGLLGKLLFASNVLIQFSNEKVSQVAMTAALIDLIFVLLFGIFISKFYSNH